ncbi:MAG: bifunctional 23S rRNA (guanine(2069)-N(7))-methyltransferase RlmK/23S rRNA (guanine(2445)-N(2))-methyltransferase RlmL [Coriobacteriales bacterium]|jgi:23S rRNA (guanine2445-N2)-methyltransferase / 23S rRNA (guanine2069-N7)-methyltransferase
MQADRYGKLEFFASCAKGFEKVVASELSDLGITSVRPLSSGVSFRATLEQACRCILWSRCASRVLLNIDRVAASTSDELYDGVASIPWEEHISEGKTLAVFAKGENEAMRNSHFVSLRVKDAICDRLRDTAGWRPDVDTKNPDFSIRVNLHSDKATISLDLCGEPLGKRGYMRYSGNVESPMNETMAAALLLQSGWKDIASAGGCLVDPFCGSGTIAIEGAMIAADVAPGVLRQKWGIQGWRQFDPQILDRLLDEADGRAEAGVESVPPIIASDIDQKAVDLALGNAKRAGVAGIIDFRCCDVSALDASGLPNDGLIATQPPFGDRPLGAGQLPSILTAVKGLAQCGDCSWGVSLVVSDDGADAVIGAKPESEIATYNGPDEVSLRCYAPGLSSGEPEVAEAVDAQTVEFVNRIRKMARHRGKWARRTGVSCYRIYDSDLPEFAMSVDLYEGAGPDEGKKWAYVCEYAAPKTIDSSLATARAASALSAIREQLGLQASDVFFKRRVRSKGGSQYGTVSTEGRAEAPKHVISEGGHQFYVSFEDKIDTGIFLDGRLIRKIIQDNSRGKSFLNLFAYTGTASVYAAAGGAVSTHTVDLSQTYLDWARENMELNGFTGQEHTFERADVLGWVEDVRHSRQRFDLVYIDPPTFSNSKKMRAKSWDVQRDHVELLIDVSRILTRNGAAIFCCNLRNFKPDVESLRKANVGLVDLSKRTIPDDFERNSKIHHCYIVKRIYPSESEAGKNADKGNRHDSERGERGKGHEQDRGRNGESSRYNRGEGNVGHGRGGGQGRYGGSRSGNRNGSHSDSTHKKTVRDGGGGQRRDSGSGRFYPGHYSDYHEGQSWHGGNRNNNRNGQGRDAGGRQGR